MNLFTGWRIGVCTLQTAPRSSVVLHTHSLPAKFVQTQLLTVLSMHWWSCNRGSEGESPHRRRFVRGPHSTDGKTSPVTQADSEQGLSNPPLLCMLSICGCSASRNCLISSVIHVAADDSASKEHYSYSDVRLGRRGQRHILYREAVVPTVCCTTRLWLR